MIDNDDKYIYISKQADLDYLIKRINNGPLFAYEFKFTERKYFIALLEALEIHYEEFTKTYYYYDKHRQLHISESKFKYVWISTYGLIAKDKSTINKAVNACVNQYTTVSLLLDKAIEICSDEKVYDVDGYNFGVLSELSPALFHNLLFYVEVLFKAYLSLSGNQAPYIHKISDIHSIVIDTMFEKNHNDTLFQSQIIDPLSKIVNHVESIPADFKEQFVKYDDNPNDSTVILFQPDSLNKIKQVIELSNDFIIDYFYTGNETHYLNTGLFQMILDKAKDKDEKKKVRLMYEHFILKDKLK
ncbi:MAG: hypothetical protein ACLFQM_11290 [Fidelibacterota bacterium]